MERLLRRLHHWHRALGSALCLLLVVWFASGAVMTFAAFPHYTSRERLSDAQLLPTALEPKLPAALERRIAEGGTEELRLGLIGSEPRWLWSSARGRETLVAEGTASVPPLSAARARSIAERLTRASALAVTYVAEPDQWTVPLPAAFFPLWRAELGDAQGTELYLSVKTGEVLQRSSRRERLLAWLGAIPHWIYPTLLRRERTLWRNSVIVLASAALLLTISGLLIGVDTQRRVWRKRSRLPRVRDPYLRLHQRIGLGFGALASSWLFSGILSFTPMDWTHMDGVFEQAQSRLAGVVELPFALSLGEALRRCGAALPVVELSLRALVGVPLAVCHAADGRSRVVRLDRADAQPRAQLELTLQQRVAAALAAPHSSTARLIDRSDLYYYATHASPDLPLPVLQIQAADAAHSAFYLDPRAGDLVALHTDRTRLERFLFHGLHSWDLPFLYRNEPLWRGCLWLAMLFGVSLSTLGLAMALRRLVRRLRRPS